jgi:pimeloyl-ACP methyl ester carboxylesterase
MPAYFERHWTSRDGLTLYARDYPVSGDEEGLPVIALHGLTRNSKDFEVVAPLIAAMGRRVVVPDVRGRGRSEWDPNPSRYQPKIYARDVTDMMKALEIDRAVFVGTSMGGIITMALAAMRPRAVAAAILNDVGPAVAPEGIARILSYAGQAASICGWDDAAGYMAKTNGVAFPAFGEDEWMAMARRTFRERDGVPQLDYDPAISVVLSKPPSRFAGWIAGLLFRKLAQKRPTLLLRGELSDVISADIASRMQRVAPGMQRVDIPKVGHAPMLTEPSAVDAIRNFLRTVP